MAISDKITPELIAQLQALSDTGAFATERLRRINEVFTDFGRLTNSVALPKAFPKPFKVVQVEVPEHEKDPLFGRF